MNNFRGITPGQFALSRIFKMHDEYSPANSYLRCGKTYTLCLVKSFMHIIKKYCKPFVKFFNGSAYLVQRFIFIC